MAKTNTKVVIIIPTYNEKGNVDKLAEHLIEVTFPKIKQGYDLSILVVDDSSPDGTAEVVRKLSKKYKQIHLLVNKNKAGLGNAYTKGMEYALSKLGADIVFEFDADFSHDPKNLAPMLEKLNEGNDLVLGSRYIKGGSIPENWGWHRKFFSKVGNWLIRTILGNWSIKDWTTGYRAIDRQVVENILPSLNQEKFMGYTFQIGFLHNAVKQSYKVAEVPIHFKDRALGKSKLGSEYVKNTLNYILKVRIRELYNSRLFKFLVVGGVGTLIQFMSFQIIWGRLTYQMSVLISIEMAIISNFILNNAWTFEDKKLKSSQIPLKFIEFNIASLGSLAIQMLVTYFGAKVIGIYELFTLPILGITISTGIVYLAVGILVGMVWNYFAYSRIVWQIKKK